MRPRHWLMGALLASGVHVAAYAEPPACPKLDTGAREASTRAFGLDGIDLDFEPDAFFGIHQGEQIAGIVAQLRKALGEQAFISVEMPGDWETLRSFDCPADTRCRRNFGAVAHDAYVSLMGYEFHGPDYPGPVTGNNSNPYDDPAEPLLPGLYHVSDARAVEYLTFRYVPVGRILLGYPAYFVAYGGVESAGGDGGLYQPFDRSKTPAYDLGVKGHGSDRVAQTLLASGFEGREVLVNGGLSAVYAYSRARREWISYDNAASIASKAHYVLDRHLAGMMMWEIGEDLPIDSPSSLLRSAHQALLGDR